jgi:hypothetical protein
MKKIPTDSFQFKIVKVDGKKTVALTSRQYYQHFLNTKTKEGDTGTMTISLAKPTRSEQQLRYYAVVVGLIADNCGYTWEECHDAIMKLKWGTKKVKIGKDIVEVRKSISNGARFGKSDMIETIEFAMEKAFELDIVVPTKQELGYIDN